MSHMLAPPLKLRRHADEVHSITQMYVKNSFSKRRIGTALLKGVIEKVFTENIIEQITLSVVETNKEAIALYKRSGFKEYGILENCIKIEDHYVADIPRTSKHKLQII